MESGLQKEAFELRAQALRQALAANTSPHAAMEIAWQARERFVEEVIEKADYNMYCDKSGTKRDEHAALRKQL